jgi:hypothetical protein
VGERGVLALVAAEIQKAHIGHLTYLGTIEFVAADEIDSYPSRGQGMCEAERVRLIATAS